MEEDALASPQKLRLLALLVKSQEVVRFAPDEDCDMMLSELSSFCAEALSRKDRALRSTSYSQLDLSDLIASKPPAKRSKHVCDVGENAGGPVKKRAVCRCEPFAGTCSQDTLCSSCHSGFCSCCEGYPQQPSTALTSPSDAVVSMNSYCADCLCSLSLTQHDVLQQETEFSMMVGWFGAHAEQWEWIPVAVNDYGVFESVWKWLTVKNVATAGMTLDTLGKSVAEAVVQSPESNLSDVEQEAWLALTSGTSSVHAVSTVDRNFERHLWPRLLEVLPDIAEITIYHLGELNQVESELVRLERHIRRDIAGTEHLCLLLWNRRVSPHYDLLIPKHSNGFH